jgi:hypothetical protein
MANRRRCAPEIVRLKSMVLTDRFLSKSDLKAVSERIKSGEAVTYPEEVVRGYAEMLAQMPVVQGPDWHL